MKKEGGSVETYLKSFPTRTQKLLAQVRAAVKKAAPKSVETMKYGIVAYVLEGNLVFFGGFKNHVGFYPVPSALRAFEKELSKYEGSKGTVRFPLDKPMPIALIKKIVAFRIRENKAKTQGKKTTKSGKK